jgi:hypothetical protein
MTGPVGTRRQYIGKLLPNAAGGRHGATDQDDAAHRRQRRRLGEFAKILVECQQNTLFARGLSQHLRIGTTGSRHPDPNDIVPGTTKSGDRRAGNISIGKKAHIKPRSDTLSRNSAYPLRTKTSDDVFVRDAGVVGQNIWLRPPVRQQTNHKLHREPGPADDRLAAKDIGRQ